MSQVVTIGLDIAKSVFQLHGVDAASVVLLCLISARTCLSQCEDVLVR